jgi:hypothetical protein
MDREISSDYSYTSSRSRISYISNFNNLIQDTSTYNQANILDMIRNMQNDRDDENLENVQEDNIEDSNENENDNDNESNTINSYELFDEMSLLSNKKRRDFDDSYEDRLLEDPEFLLLNQARASTAPIKPLNDTETYKNSLQYINLEKAVLYCNRLILEPSGDKFDVDSDEGIFICKKFLDQLEKLIKVKIIIINNEYKYNNFIYRPVK